MNLFAIAGLICAVSCILLSIVTFAYRKKKIHAILAFFNLAAAVWGLNIASLIAENDFKIMNKGSLAELFVGLELIKNSPPSLRSELYYWHREKKASNAEVDYVIQKNDDIIPIEVKSGYTGQMQSLKLFMQKHNSKIGARISLENFAKFGNIEAYPIYAIKNILRPRANGGEIK